MPILCLSPAMSQTGVEENAGTNLSLISCSWSNPPPPLFKIFLSTQIEHSLVYFIRYPRPKLLLELLELLKLFRKIKKPSHRSYYSHPKNNCK